MRLKELLPKHIRYILSVYVLGIIVFTLFRLILLLTELDRLNNLQEGEGVILFLQAFFMGFRFDTVISGYILILPFIILLIFSIFRTNNPYLYKGVSLFTFFLYLISFVVCSSDIPYFNQFFARFSMSAFQWVDTPGFVFSMVLGEARYWGMIIPFVVVSVLFYRYLKRFTDNHLINDNYQKGEGRIFASAGKNLLYSVVVLILIFIGVRGRFSEKSPIRVGTAYFSNNAFANQLSLNPVFTLIKSYEASLKSDNKSINLIENSTALKNVQKYININDLSVIDNPIAREIIPDSTINENYNVVLVIMESMSSAKMTKYNKAENLTTHIDSLADNGYFFNNIYTSGIHTYNGVYSTLFSYPSLFKQHPLKGVEMQKYHGISSVLKEKGYSTMYFTTHDDQFDNIGGFLKANDFDRIISQKDYPSDKVLSTLGVPDDYMFDFSIPVIDEASSKEKPFLAVFMTASDHGPFNIPEYFTPKHDDIKKQVVEYADWSIGKFMNDASKQDWYKNTLFVFIADHGAAMDVTYDMPMNYHHSPLIFYAPEIIKEHKEFDCIGGQIDVFPTIMGILNQPYINNTLGVDLLKECRPCIYFCADDKYGVVDNEHFLVVRNNKITSLYKYKNKDTKDYSNEFDSVVGSLNNYAISSFQSAQWLIDNKKTNILTE